MLSLLMLNKIILILILLTSPCLAAYEGVWTGDEWRADNKILFAKAPTLSTDVLSGKTEVIQEPEQGEFKQYSCVEIDGNGCVESEYFKPTFSDHDPSKNYPEAIATIVKREKD